MRAAFLVALLAGCGVSADDRVDALASLARVDPPGAEDALAIVTAAYEHETGVAMSSVNVTWVAERIPYDKTTVIGLHRGCDDVWLTWWDGARFGGTALAHEVGHCARTLLGLNSDHDHLDAAWWSRRDVGTVERVRRQLDGAGL